MDRTFWIGVYPGLSEEMLDYVDHAQQFQDVPALPAALIQALDQRQFDLVAVDWIPGGGAGLEVDGKKKARKAGK